MTPPERTLTGRKNDPGFEWGALRALVPYIWPQGQTETKLRVVIALSLLALATALDVYIPIIYKEAVEILGGEAGTTVALPLGLLLGYGILRVSTIVFAELRDAVFAKVGQRAIRQVALRTFRHLHALSLRYHLDRQTGGLSRVIERGTKGIEFLITFMLFNILPTLFKILMVCGVLWALFNFWYALITFTTITCYIAYTMVVTEWRLKYRRRMNETDQRANTRAIDSLLNYETVKYFGNEDFEARRYDRSLENYEQAAVKSKTSLALLNVGQAAIIGIGLTIVMMTAGVGVIERELTVGDFVLVNMYMIQLYMPLNFLGFVYREIKQSLVDMEAMFHLLDVSKEIQDSDDALPLEITEGTIEFRDVSFGYDPRRTILHNVSFKVPAGKKIAIVGPSGAGKSTISRILFRFYDVNQGAVLIDGQDLRDVTQSSVRAAIGIVPQDTVLFNDTIQYNIAYGRADADSSEIEDAAKLSAIHDFIMSTPDGYETMVGERGLKLSGGEKQRVAIARTILKAPKIMLFDEATSALDTRTEREIQSALKKVSEDRTTLLIAHRLSTVVDADEILVLDQGRIVERGNHVFLLAQNKVYAAMWKRQQQSELDKLFIH